MKTLKIGIHQNPELEQDLTSLKAQEPGSKQRKTIMTKPNSF
jgi:hypothetical protein